jgi:hypothetical protein
LEFPNFDPVNVAITSGLIRDRDPDADNYGVYFYCNNRLIVKELRTREVGYFVTSEAGVPHPDASLCRAIVQLNGPARLMPWNSSKTGINTAHPVFQLLRPRIIQLVSHFSSLSRRLKDDWDDSVFGHNRGKITETAVSDPSSPVKLRLPELPRVNKTQGEQLKARNKKKIRDQPWTLGLVEAIAAVGIVVRQRLETRNRIALLLLDSSFEIALKEFITHRDDLFPARTYTDAHLAGLFARRSNVLQAVTAQIQIPPVLLKKAEHYYRVRNKLVHERATVDVTEADINNYKATVEKILKILFGLRF